MNTQLNPNVTFDLSTSSKPSIAFDLDETLIYSYSLPPKNSTITTFPIRIGRKRVYITTRPGLRQFLDKIEEIYEVFIFTSSLEEYANKVIDKIAPEIDHEHRLFRNSCTKTDGYHIKDLTHISRPLNKLILVDDMSCSAQSQVGNLIRISPFMGDIEDQVLSKELFPALEICSKAEDIRTVAFEVISTRNYPSLHMCVTH